MIEAAALRYTYPKALSPALDNFSATLSPCEIVALTGPNGAGKTTFARLLTGILRPEAGSLTVDGQNAAELTIYQLGRLIGYLFQDPSRQLFCDTVENEIAFGLKNLSLPEAQIGETVSYYLNMFHIASLKDAFPGTLSQGEKQRVVLASVLSMGTSYLVLDEPTNGLDMKTRRALADMLVSLRESRRAGMFLISHDRDFISLVADREQVIK